ncbi:hypothetical protein EDB19DRAFT_1835556 [Suillus lakei]|nr:hypothetical protein EDB19DRAFT_1835556 [Suillus lakei]
MGPQQRWLTHLAMLSQCSVLAIAGRFARVARSAPTGSFAPAIAAGDHHSVRATRLAVGSVLSDRFPQSHVVGPSILGTEYTTAGMSLEDVAVMRHHSEGQEECNRDPDVEEILRRSAHGLATAELASSMCGYTKTGPLKREFPDRTASASASSKKQRLQGMEMDRHSAPPPCHPSLPSKPTPLAVFKRAPFKPPPLITPQVEAIAAPMEPPPSLGSASILMCPTARSTSACRKSEGKVKRDARRRKLQTQDPSRRVEEMRSNGDVDALCFRVSRTGWQGTNLASSQEGRALRNEWYDYSVLFRLTGFETVPYHGLKTRVRDSQGRLWLVRTFVGPRIERLLPFFEEDAAIFEEFPLLARRYRACAEALRIQPLYGHFFNFCLNSARAGVRRVHCSPHVDWKNIAIGVCVVFIYGKFNSKERSWLVIWEAGLVVEMPAGVFVMYPSSLFFHFNVDMCVCVHQWCTSYRGKFIPPGWRRWERVLCVVQPGHHVPEC